MSYDALDWSMPKIIADVNVKSCLNVLAFHHNKETGLCCPSISTIAEEMGVKSLNTVRKSLKSLEAMGLIKAFQVCKESGKVIRTEYELNLSSKAFIPVKTTTRKVHVMNDDGSCSEASQNEASQDESYGACSESSMVHDVNHMVHVVNPNKEYNKEEQQGSKQEIHHTENSAPKKSLVSEEELFSELPPPSDEDIRATVTVTESSPKKRNTTSREVIEKPEGVDDDLWKEWNQFRKKKRAPVTPRVLSNLARQTSNAGISISEGMVIQMEQGWTGFQASWIKPDMRHTANNAPQVDEWTQKNLGKKINGQIVLLRQEQRVYGNKLFQQYKKEAA